MAAIVQPCDAGVIGSTRAAALGSGMAFLDSTVVNVVLPALQADLGASAGDAVDLRAYALILAALMLVGGTLGDHYGRRGVFVVGAALFGAASVWCASAPDA